MKQLIALLTFFTVVYSASYTCANYPYTTCSNAGANGYAHIKQLGKVIAVRNFTNVW